MLKRSLRKVLPVLTLTTLPLLCAAQGGPPFITDDPGTPGDGNWETNVACITERHPDERIFNAPILDINYRPATAAWASGVVIAREVSKRLELDGELYATANTNGASHWTSFGGGGRYKIGGPMVLLFMAGRSFRSANSGQPSLFGYLGVQFLFSTRQKKGGALLMQAAPR